MRRRMLGPAEEVPWVNPVKETEPQPFLADLQWPDDPREPAWESTRQELVRFYCSDREPGGADPEALAAYLENPHKYLILWGKVGIGKTWFVRYELVAGSCNMLSHPYHAGFIDMPASAGTPYGVYRQLRHILEAYFERFCGSTEEAVRRYVKYDLAHLHVKAESDLSQTQLADIEFIVRRWMDLRSEPSEDATITYVRRLLDALQHLDESHLLILVPDNIDKTNDDDQERFVNLAVRLLRNPRIRLIIPLRKSSRLLKDRFSALREFTYHEMELQPLKLRAMLKTRFRMSKDGTSLSGMPAIEDPAAPGRTFTFPQLFVELFGKNEKQMPESGELLLTLAGSNAREVLNLTERLLHSDQLKSLRNIREGEYGLAALMLRNSSQPDRTSPGVVNLLNNDEPTAYGNALVRFRVLEYFWNAGTSTTSDESFKRYFERLGYGLEQVKRVIELFMMTQLLISPWGLGPDDIRQLPFDDVGSLRITDTGQRFRPLLDRMWYFVSAKKDVYLPEDVIHMDKLGVEFCTNKDFVEWLHDEEKREQARLLEYDRSRGPHKPDWALIRPHRLAAAALRVSYEDEE